MQQCCTNEPSIQTLGLCKTALTVSSTTSKEKSLPSPRELLQLRMLDLLVTLALMVHLDLNTSQIFVILDMYL